MEALRVVIPTVCGTAFRCPNIVTRGRFIMTGWKGREGYEMRQTGGRHCPCLFCYYPYFNNNLHRPTTGSTPVALWDAVYKQKACNAAISWHAFNHSVRTSTLRYSVLSSTMLPAPQTFPITILYSESNYSMKQIDNILYLVCLTALYQLQMLYAFVSQVGEGRRFGGTPSPLEVEWAGRGCGQIYIEFGDSELRRERGGEMDTSLFRTLTIMAPLV